MTLPASVFPDANWDGNEKSTTNDPGTITNTIYAGGDHNEFSAEILEMERLLRGKVATAHGGAQVCINKTGGALTCGKYVALNGYDATAGLPSMTLGAATAATCLDGLGLLVMEKGGDVDTVADNGIGYVVRAGTVYGIATDGMGAAGTMLWPAASGGLSSTPVAGYLPVAAVDVSHATLGVLQVFGDLGRLHLQDRHKAFNSILTPAALTGHANDYNPSGLATAGLLRLSSDGAYNITGIVAPTVAADGRELKLVNINPVNALTITDEDASSTAANRFAINANIAIAHDGGVTLVYDNTSSRWRCVGHTN